MHGPALIQAIDEAGVAVLTLTEGLEDAELLASRLTRSEVVRQLGLLCDAAQGLPEAMRHNMPEIDWPGLKAAGLALKGPPGVGMDEALLACHKQLVPTTLMWMRVYRQQHPDWFKLPMA